MKMRILIWTREQSRLSHVLTHSHQLCVCTNKLNGSIIERKHNLPKKRNKNIWTAVKGSRMRCEWWRDRNRKAYDHQVCVCVVCTLDLHFIYVWQWIHTTNRIESLLSFYKYARTNPKRIRNKCGETNVWPWSIVYRHCATANACSTAFWLAPYHAFRCVSQ